MRKRIAGHGAPLIQTLGGFPVRLVYVDETSDQKNKDYFGLCVAALDSTHYRNIKAEFQAILRRYNWDETIEFKGAFLFSATKGDTNVTVDNRIDMAEQILDLCTATKNSRIAFYYMHTMESKNQKESYLQMLPIGLKRALIKPKGKGKRDTTVVHLSCDNRQDISPAEIRGAIDPIVAEKKYTLYEDVHIARSNFDTVGILFADIVAYLAGRIATIGNDSELFENLDPANYKDNGKVQKLVASSELLNKVKAISWHEIAT